ncbi:mucin-2-like isoform X2 [Hyalella azteca]|uniref:Mucin-2-like isoform X2 n=1 Tax=Hyalella azteca TaxID=294128 RepID=A0A8B7PDT6_HYAAZ|nr:mucin-2-like isoform X2 [Hyalella azteca]
MKLLLLLSLLAVVYQPIWGDKLPTTPRLVGGYLQPQNLVAAKRCIGTTDTSTLVETKLVYQPFTKIVTVFQTVPVLSQDVETVTKIQEVISEVEVQTFNTISRTSLVTDVKTLIDNIERPLVLRTAFASVTSLSTRLQVHTISETTTHVQAETHTRTVSLTEVSTDAVFVTQTRTITLNQRPIFEPSYNTRVISITVDQTPPPVTSTFVFTNTDTATATTYVTPRPVLQDRREASTEPRIMYSEVLTYTTETNYIPVFSTGYDTVTSTVIDTATSFTASQVFAEVTRTVRKVLPSTVTIPVVTTLTATVERHVTEEFLVTSTVVGTGVHTERSPPQTIPMILTDVVTEFFTRTSEYQPPTMTKPATVYLKCGEYTTVTPSGYFYGQP